VRGKHRRLWVRHQNYSVHRDLGGAAALAHLRQRLQQRVLKLTLDFVSNHMAPDHPWVDKPPDYFVQGSKKDLARTAAAVETRQLKISRAARWKNCSEADKRRINAPPLW
jgi:hypothetical protein